MKLSLFFFLGFFGFACAQGTPPSPAIPVADTDAAVLLGKVSDEYKSLQTYSSTGTIVSNIETAGSKLQLTTTFSIKLKKPNLYLITWNQKGAMPQSLSQDGAVWSDGTQPYLYMGIMKAYSKIGDDASALGAATGISGGAAFTIPSLFIPVFTGKVFAFSRLKNPTIEKSEPVNGEDCYVVSGSSDASAKETLWISKTSSMILKYDRSLSPPPGGVVMPKISDADLEKSLHATGQPVTDASKKQMRDMMEKAEASLKKGGLSGSSTETQTAISTPNLEPADFQFTPPNDATLKESVLTPSGGFPQPAPTPTSATSNHTGP